MPLSYPDKIKNLKKAPFLGASFINKMKGELYMVKRTFRVNNYLYSKLKIMAQHYNMSINQLMIELIEIGYIEREKKDVSIKQWRNK